MHNEFAGQTPGGQADVPRIEVVRGEPTAAETAAVVAVIAARAAAAGAAAPGPDRSPAGSAWSSHSRLPRQPLAPGPGAWRASALPR